MARRRRSGTMHVLLNGRPVGQLRLAGSGAIRFSYDASWLDWEHAMPISLSLPLQEDAHLGGVVIAYLENLLPDNQVVRERVAARVRAEGTDAWTMLEKIGRDCVGALQFAAGDLPTASLRLDGEPVSEAQIAAVLRNLLGAPLGINAEDDFRISIAGAQEKTALLRHEGNWIRPSGTTPTTHILKTQIGVLPNRIDMSDSVENEYFCMSFCRAMGMNAAEVEIVDFEDVRCLVATRFDRRWTKDGRLIRLPQEDFCQALGLPPSQKYQSDGGPGIGQVINLLAASDKPEEDQCAFFRSQILFWLMAATDGHGKNFSVGLRPGGFRKTPLYDVLSAQKAFVAGQIRHRELKMSMSVGGHYRVLNILPRHFLKTAKATGFGVDLADKLLVEVSGRLQDALEETLRGMPEGFPKALAECIADGIQKRGDSLNRGT